MSRLITASLVSGIKWMKDCPPSWSKRAYESLRSSLAREWSEPEGAAALGIKFEKYLYSVLDKNYTEEEVDTHLGKSTETFRKIVHRYDNKTPEIQKKIKRFIDLDGHEYCLYGKLDIFYPDLIEDIKTTSKLMDNYDSKYLPSFQHHLYLFITDVRKFVYYIVVFNEDQTIRDTHEVHYEVEDMDKEREIVEDKIREVFAFFADYPDLFKLYQTKFCLY